MAPTGTWQFGLQLAPYSRIFPRHKVRPKGHPSRGKPGFCVLAVQALSAVIDGTGAYFRAACAGSAGHFPTRLQAASPDYKQVPSVGQFRLKR